MDLGPSVTQHGLVIGCDPKGRLGIRPGIRAIVGGTRTVSGPVVGSFQTRPEPAVAPAAWAAKPGRASLPAPSAALWITG